MNKLIKYIGLTSILSTPILIATVSATNNETNYHLTPADQEWQGNLKEKAAFWLIKHFAEKQKTDGSTIKAGEKADKVLPLLWNTIKTIKYEAIAEANLIPTIGSKIVNLIKNIQVNDLAVKDNNQILNQGENLIAVTLKIGQVQYDDLTIKIINVQPAK